MISSKLDLRGLTDEVLAEEAVIREGGGQKGVDRQHRLGRMVARERIQNLVDEGESFFELNIWAAHGMYPDVGDVPAAGVVVGTGRVSGRLCMIIANDATVKAGTFFPQTCKKMLRAQRMAFECGLPLLYLVDSAGAFLPLQDEIFPDEDDFGRIFRNNSVMSAAGLPQFSAIMGNCIAGGAYLPVLSDKILMTEGSGLYLAGPALVKAAIGQEVDSEDLGGAQMHAEISGTVDFMEKDDASCLERIRYLMDMLPRDEVHDVTGEPERDPRDLYGLVDVNGAKEYDVKEVLKCIVDAGSMEEVKPEYGPTVVCTYAKIGGHSVGIVANQRQHIMSKEEGMLIGGVIYAKSADKAARFVMDCNQMQIPVIFIQDVMGFMVGRDAEHSGIIRSGAKLVNALSNAIVPKITIIIGGSFGAGNYAMCGKAYDPRFIFAWPNAKYAVMGAEQASGVIFDITKRAAQRDGIDMDEAELDALKQKVYDDYAEKSDIRYGAARGWVDGIIAPDTTRDVLMTTLELVKRPQPEGRYHTGVIQT